MNAVDKRTRRLTMAFAGLALSCCVSFGLGATLFRGRQRHAVLVDPLDRRLEIPAPFFEGDGAFELVEVLDFECPYSAGAYKALRDACAGYGGRMRCALVPYPGRRREYAAVYTKGYLSARRQGRGSGFAEALFAQHLWRSRVPRQEGEGHAYAAAFLAADRAGLDLDRFEADIYCESVKELCDSALASVRSARLRAIPTVFVNGYRVEGALESAAYRMAIEKIASR